MPRHLVPRLLRVLRGLILLRTLRRNPLIALFVVVLFDRRSRRLAAGLLFDNDPAVTPEFKGRFATHSDAYRCRRSPRVTYPPSRRPTPCVSVSAHSCSSTKGALTTHSCRASALGSGEPITLHWT
jgi:hypothetical protein